MTYRHRSDERLLVALACGASVDSAARSAGISPRTAHRRLKDPEFQRRLRDRGVEMVRRATDVLTAATMEAAKSLLAFQNPSTRDTVRLAAARAILEFGIKLREGMELLDRMAALEAQVGLTYPGPDDNGPNH